MKKFIDLSVSLEEGITSDPDFMLPKINYHHHQDTAEEIMSFFPGLKKEDLPGNCYTLDDDKSIGVLVSRVDGQKCERCWKYFSKLTDNVCIRCKEVIE